MAEEDGFAWADGGEGEDAAAGSFDAAGGVDDAFELEAEGGGLGGAVVAAVEGDDGITEGEFAPPVGDKAWFEVKHIPVEGDGAIHVGGGEDVFDDEGFHGRGNR